MANSTNQILNKSLSELRKKQTSLSKEIENIATAISTTGTDKARYVENCRSDLKRIGVQV